MRIDPAGVEYVHIPITGAPFDAGALEVSFDPADIAPLDRTWTEAQWNDTKTLATVLVGGPDAPGSGYVILPVGRWPVRVRLADLPEAIIRNTNAVIEVRA